MLEFEEEEETPKAPVPEKKVNVVSGGLAGFHVASDLLNIDFSPPEEAPEEFRAVAYNSAAPKEIRRGASGQQLCATCICAGGLAMLPNVD